MIEGLLWIIGSYAVGIALVHWSFGSRRGKPKLTYYVLLTRDNQSQMEWYLRSLYFFSWVKGKHIAVTIIDEGSTDDTIPIAKRISGEKQFDIQVNSAPDALDRFMAEHLEEEVIVMKLSGIDDSREVPVSFQ